MSRMRTILNAWLMLFVSCLFIVGVQLLLMAFGVLEPNPVWSTIAGGVCIVVSGRLLTQFLFRKKPKHTFRYGLAESSLADGSIDQRLVAGCTCGWIDRADLSPKSTDRERFAIVKGAWDVHVLLAADKKDVTNDPRG